MLCPDPPAETGTQRPNYIFVDFENVQPSDLSRVDKDCIKIVLVVGQHQNKLPIEFINFLYEHPGQLRAVQSPTRGKNALDFILAFEIGQTLALEPEAYIHIISKDTGFDALVAHLREKGHHVARHTKLSEIPILFRTDERLDHLVARLKNPESSRPTKRRTLENTIQQFFNRSLTPETVEKTIELLIKDKVLTISDTGKVSYS